MVGKLDKNSATSKQKAKQRWQRAVDKFKIATIPDTYVPSSANLSEELVDCVRVGIRSTIEEADESPYLEEIAQRKHTYNIQLKDRIVQKEFKMLSMSPKQLQKCELTYDKQGFLKDNQGNIASTIGKFSKGRPDEQAFVMSKQGQLYCATHTGRYNPDHSNLSHASFLQGRPAEMAGMLSIKDGKITFISAKSGHYAPDPLDMYRGIKKLDKLMPNVIDPECNIIYFEGNQAYESPVKEFVKIMEAPVGPNKLKHEQLREDRISELKRYHQNLKQTPFSLTFKTNITDIIDLFANLPIIEMPANNSQNNEAYIAEILKTKSNVILTFKRDRATKPSNINISDIINKVLDSGNKVAITNLLNSGFTNRVEFAKSFPLSRTEHNGGLENIKTLLSNKNVRSNMFDKYDIRLVMLKSVNANNIEQVQILIDKLKPELTKSLIQTLKNETNSKEILSLLDSTNTDQVAHGYDTPKKHTTTPPVPAPRGKNKVTDENFDLTAIKNIRQLIKKFEAMTEKSKDDIAHKKNFVNNKQKKRPLR